jgi:hypothetical protein
MDKVLNETVFTVSFWSKSMFSTDSSEEWLGDEGTVNVVGNTP